MKSIILLFEGFDGAGKTTLIHNFQQFLHENGFTSMVINSTGNKITEKINFAMKDNDVDITPTTEILLRFAREFERIEILKDNFNKYNYIILDRGILSAISWINYYKLSYNDYKLIINKIINELDHCKLIFCFLPFEDSWNRVLSRGNLTKKERKGKEINFLMHKSQRETFLKFDFPRIIKYEICTLDKIEDCLTKLLTILKIETQN